MNEPKIYYGPWIPEVPATIPDGTVWEVRHTDYEPDFGSTPMPVRCVSFAGWLIYEDGPIARSSITSLRRVYPPGSILPEPRPVIDIISLNLDGRWAIGQIHHKGVEWEFRQIEKWDFAQADYPLDEFIAYPVDLLPNGAFVPRPWPDSGCTTE